MDWNHLPVSGGIYDQHPQLLDEWSIIWAEKAKHQKEEEAKRKREQDKASPKKSRFGRRR